MDDLNVIDFYWFYDPDFGFAPDYDEALEISESLETVDV